MENKTYEEYDGIDYKINVVDIEDYDPDYEYPENTVFRIVLDGATENDCETFRITQEDIENVKAEMKWYKLRYIGESFGVASLTDGKIYDAIDFDKDYYRVYDDSNEGYLYSRINPAPVDGSSPGGRWEILEEKVIN